MTRMTLTREIAWAASLDEGNRSMREAGRTAWSQQDYNAAVREFDRLWPEERDIEAAREAYEQAVIDPDPKPRG